MLPLPLLPKPLRTSVSAKELGGVKETAVDLQSRRLKGSTAIATESNTPVLLFPDDDDASNISAGSGALSPYLAEGTLAGDSRRASEAGAATGVRFALHSSEVGCGSAKSSDRSDSPNQQLGLNMDNDMNTNLDMNTDINLDIDNLEGGGIAVADQKMIRGAATVESPTSSLPVNIPLSPPISRTLTSSKSVGGGSLTPPLVPRSHYPHSQHHNSHHSSNNHSHNQSVDKTATVNALLSPPMRHRASEYVHPAHTRLAMQQQIQTSRQRQQQQQQRSHQHHRQLRRASTRQLWTLMRQQVCVMHRMFVAVFFGLSTVIDQLSILYFYKLYFYPPGISRHGGVQCAGA